MDAPTHGEEGLNGMRSETHDYASQINGSQEPSSMTATQDVADQDSSQDQVGREADQPFLVIAQYAYRPDDHTSLSFVRGDVIEVLTQLPSGWWDGLLEDRRGWFPSNYVRRLEPSELGHASTAQAESAGLLGDDDGERTTEDQVDLTIINTQMQNSAQLNQSPEIMSTEDETVHFAREEDHQPRRGVELDRDMQLNGNERNALGNLADEDSERMQIVNIEDFWVPSLTEDGQIYYHNTQTDETSWEMPNLTPDGDDGDDDNYPESVFPPSGITRSHIIPPRGSSREEAIDFDEMRQGPYPDDDDDEAAGLDRDDGFSPFGLRNRLSELNMASHKDKVVEAQGYNVAEQEMNRNPSMPNRPGMDRRPSGMSTESSSSFSMKRSRSGTTGSSKGKSRKALGEAFKAFGIIRNSSISGATGPSVPFAKQGSLHNTSTSGWNVEKNGTLDRAVKRLSGANKSDGSAMSYGKSPLDLRASMQSTLSSATSPSRSISFRKSRDSSFEASRRKSTLAWEEEAAARLETMINNEQAAMDIEMKIEDVSAALDDLVQASTTLVSVLEAREVEFDSGEGQITRLPEAEALMRAVANIGQPVRHLVQACRHAILGLPAVVIDTLSDIPSQIQSQEYALSFLSSEGLHPSQRRIVAALSKIVFFTHSAAGMDWPVPGCAGKIAKDAVEVLGSIELFVSEVRRHGCLSESGRGIRQIQPTWGFNEMMLSRKRDWRRLDGPALKKVDQIVIELTDLISAQSPEHLNRTQLERCAELAEELEVFLRDLDVAATLDLEASTTPPTPGESSTSLAKVNYAIFTSRAIEHKSAYDAKIAEIRSLSSRVMWTLMDQNPAPSSTDDVESLCQSCRSLPSLLEEMATNATRQAEVVASGQLKGHIGRRSSRVLEREKIARRMRSSSRSSSLASPYHLAPRRDRNSQMYDDNDNESLRSQDHKTRPFANRSQQSLHARQASLGRGAISASSSISNLSGAVDFDMGPGHFGSVRNSTANMVKSGVPFMRNRSVSEVDIRPTHSPVQGSKKKLAKWLGEDEVSDIISPGHVKVIAEEHPIYLGVDYSDDDIIINADGSIKAGTLVALIERLTLHDRTDHSFNATFLMTYRSFATGSEVVDQLIKRYHIQIPPGLTPEQIRDWQDRKQKPIKLRVFNILKTWLDQHFNEEEDPEILTRIQAFATDVLALDDQVKMPHTVLIRAVQRRQNESDANVRRLTVTTGTPPTSIIPKVNPSRGLQLLDIDAEELARQMTIFEADLYNRILPVDCLDKAWSRIDSPSHGAHIKAMILASNRIAGWVAHAVLSHVDPKRRAQIMKHFLHVANHCRSFNNFSTMFAIMAGVNSTPIIRLKRTKDMLSAKSVALWDSMDKLLDAGRNHSGYKELLKRVNPPCIPFLGAYLTYLTMIEDGNADMLPCPAAPNRKLIHFAKRQKCADVIREIQQYQATPYSFNRLEMVLVFLRERLEHVESAPDAYDLSIKLEPRERDDEKIARMLRESGMI